MEAVLMTTPHRAEQSVANPKSKSNSNKILEMRIKTPNSSKRNKGGRGAGSNFNSHPSPSPSHQSYAGLLNPPLPRAMSLSQPQTQPQQQLPPLLPLPCSANHNQPLLCRSLSSTQALSSRKKSKPTKREDSANKRSSSSSSSSSSTLLVASDNGCWGPDPKDLPKHLPLVLTLRAKGIDQMLSSPSLLSPPPSSLPLPKFSLMSSKLITCNAEAAAVDHPATNNLRRLLRLR